MQAPLAQLPWYHHLALLTKIDHPELRSWYAAAALHIDGRFHERAGKAVTNFATALPSEESDLAQQATRDPYLFDFLGATDGWREREVEVEKKLVEHVGKFLLELGQGFAFIGQQVRLEWRRRTDRRAPALREAIPGWELRVGAGWTHRWGWKR